MEKRNTRHVPFEEDTVSREKEFRESFHHSTFSRAVPVSIEKNAPVSWESSGFCQRVGLVSGIFLGLGGARSEGLVLSAACALHSRDEYGFQRVGAFWENFSNVRAQNLFDRRNCLNLVTNNCVGIELVKNKLYNKSILFQELEECIGLVFWKNEKKALNL